MTDTDFDDADLTRTCTRKKGYPTEGIAKLAASSIRRTSPGAAVRVYACRRCGQYHVGGGSYSDVVVAAAPVETREERGDDRFHSRIRRANQRTDAEGGYSRARRRRSRRPMED